MRTVLTEICQASLIEILKELVPEEYLITGYVLPNGNRQILPLKRSIANAVRTIRWCHFHNGHSHIPYIAGDSRIGNIEQVVEFIICEEKIQRYMIDRINADRSLVNVWVNEHMGELIALEVLLKDSIRVHKLRKFSCK